MFVGTIGYVDGRTVSFDPVPGGWHGDWWMGRTVKVIGVGRDNLLYIQDSDGRKAWIASHNLRPLQY